MSAGIKTLKDILGNIIYPKTLTKAIYDENNNRLDNTLSTKQNAADNSLPTGNKTITGAIKELFEGKQNITDKSLETTGKTIVSAINEVLASVSSHINNKQNPHQTTYLQTNAAPSSHIADTIAKITGEHGIRYYGDKLAYKNTDNTWTDIKTGGNTTVKNYTVDASKWKDETSELGFYTYDISNILITATTRVNVYFNYASVVIASVSGVSTITTSTTGHTYLYSSSLPASNLICDLVLEETK